MDSYPNKTVLVAKEGGVATLTLNRPEKLNALNNELSGEWSKAMWSLDADEDVRAIVVTGAGRAFCAGLDLMERTATQDDPPTGEFAEDTGDIVDRWAFWRMATPVIVAINGVAYGGGITIPLLCDVVYAAEDAPIAFNFSRIGIVPEANSLWLISRLIGASRALELLMTGRTFTGGEAAELGLVAKALPREEVLETAQALAREIAEHTAPGPVAMIKRTIYEELERGDRAAAMAYETEMVLWFLQQADAREGIMATLEKRKPVWQGSKHVAGNFATRS